MNPFECRHIRLDPITYPSPNYRIDKYIYRNWMHLLFPFVDSDRLIDHPDSWQARKFVPQILKMSNTNGTLTFGDFVQYLIGTSPEEFDSHWARITDHCQPELIHYDAIVQIETIDEDMFNLFNYTDTETDLFSNNSRATDENLTLEYFDGVDENSRQQLYEIYKEDFLFFNYTMQP